MRHHITAHTIANTVRMGSRSRRPRAVFLASDETDIALLATLLTRRECRVVQAHSRQNAAQAFGILVSSGYQGVVTAVNTRFAPPTETELAVEATDPAKYGVSFEGLWEQVKASGGVFSGQRVRVTVLDNVEPAAPGADARPPENRAMLASLAAIKDILRETKPKTDKGDYLREAREGEMYDFRHES
jgi:hypothetical protein